MFKQIRTLLSDKDLQLEGAAVEVDETYFGGRSRARHQKAGRPGLSSPQKKPIVGIVERSGRVIAKATNDITAQTLLGMVREHVLPETTVYTDEYPSYKGLGKMPQGYHHKRIHHASKVYVMGTFIPTRLRGFGRY